MILCPTLPIPGFPHPHQTDKKPYQVEHPLPPLDISERHSLFCVIPPLADCLIHSVIITLVILLFLEFAKALTLGQLSYSWLCSICLHSPVMTWHHLVFIHLLSISPTEQRLHKGRDSVFFTALPLCLQQSLTYSRYLTKLWGMEAKGKKRWKNE